MEIKTLRDLKEFLNTLNETQLDQVAVVSQEDSFVRIGEAFISEETYVYNEDSEGLIPVDEYDPEYYDGIPLTDEEYNTIVPPGRVFIDEEIFFDEPNPYPIETLDQIITRVKASYDSRPIGLRKFASEVACQHFFSQMQSLKRKV